MSKLGIEKLDEKKKSTIVIVITLLLALINFLPLHYVDQQRCSSGGVSTTEGTTLGVPFIFFRTAHQVDNTCVDFTDISVPTKSFSAQALISDGLVFGVMMVGLNYLLDRRVKP